MAIRSALAGAAVVATVVTITACAQSDAPGTQSQADGPLFSPPTSTAAASPPTADDVVVQIEGTGYTCESLMKLLEPARSFSILDCWIPRYAVSKELPTP